MNLNKSYACGWGVFWRSCERISCAMFGSITLTTPGTMYACPDIALHLHLFCALFLLTHIVAIFVSNHMTKIHVECYLCMLSHLIQGTHVRDLDLEHISMTASGYCHSIGSCHECMHQQTNLFRPQSQQTATLCGSLHSLYRYCGCVSQTHSVPKMYGEM